MGPEPSRMGPDWAHKRPRPLLDKRTIFRHRPPQEVAKSVREEGYSVGKLLKFKFEVSHPDHGTVTVGAVNEAAAIVAAAAAWGVRWQPYAFYAWCVVRRAAV